MVGDLRLLTAVAEFKFFCPTTRCKFISDATCINRMGHTPYNTIGKRGRYNSSGVNTYSTIYHEACSACPGPLPISDLVAVEEPRPLKTEKPKPAPAATRLRKPRPAPLPPKVETPKRKARPVRFAELGPDDPWTGRGCGCLKKKSEFFDQRVCKACRTKQKNKAYKGHYLHTIKIDGIRYYEPQEGQSIRGLRMAIGKEADRLHKSTGLVFRVQMVGGRVRAMRTE